MYRFVLLFLFVLGCNRFYCQFDATSQNSGYDSSPVIASISDFSFIQVEVQSILVHVEIDGVDIPEIAVSSILVIYISMALWLRWTYAMST